jgi:hypothetical protein
VPNPAIELADQIKEKGQLSTAEWLGLLRQAELLAQDETQDRLTRALAYRAAGNAHQLLNQFQAALDNYDKAASHLGVPERACRVAAQAQSIAGRPEGSAGCSLPAVTSLFLGRIRRLYKNTRGDNG